MAYLSRDSSLRSQNLPMYHFTGSLRPENEAYSNTVSLPQQTTTTIPPPPQTLFDDSDYEEEAAHIEYDTEDEKTGFSTPDSSSEKPLSYSYPSPLNRNHKISPKPPAIYINNDWQKGTVSGTGEPDDEFLPEAFTRLVRSRAFKRYVSLYIVTMIGVWLWWFRHHAPKQMKSTASTFLIESLKGRFEDDSEWGYFGTNKRVEFAGMQHLRDLDRSLVPGSDVLGVQNRRLIVVGDIHGYADEFETLLARVSFDPSKDHLISTGDMISRGPSSSKVIDIMMEYNASCVRGDNEDRVLHAYRDHHAPSHQKVLIAQDPLVAPSAIPLKRGHHRDLALAASLSASQISYISSCPIILNLGAIPSMGSNVSVVHAGLIPGVAFERQDPTAAMTMRSIDLRNQVPSPHHPPNPTSGPPARPRNRLRKPDYSEWDEQGRQAVLPWGEVWDAFQDLIPTFIAQGEVTETETETETETPNPDPPPQQQQTPKANPYASLSPSTLIHAHDSRHGSTTPMNPMGKWHLGLEGGCHHGGKLTALIIEETGVASLPGFAGGRGVKRRVVSVECRDHEVGGQRGRRGNRRGWRAA